MTLEVLLLTDCSHNSPTGVTAYNLVPHRFFYNNKLAIIYQQHIIPYLFADNNDSSSELAFPNEEFAEIPSLSAENKFLLNYSRTHLVISKRCVISVILDEEVGS